MATPQADQEIAKLQRDVAELQRLLRTKADSNQAQGTVTALRGSAVPQVSGVVVTKGVKNITVNWDNAPMRDFKLYQVQVSSDQAFTTIAKTSYPRVNYVAFDDLDSSTATWYVRIRAWNTRNTKGNWSATTSSALGTADTPDLAVGASTELSSFTKSSGFTTLNTDGETETYGPVTVTTVAESIVVPATAFSLEYQSNFTSGYSNYTFEALRRPSGGTDADDEILETVVQDVFSDVLVASTTTAPIIFVPDQPGAGTWEYRLRVTVNVNTGLGNTLSFTGNSLKMRFFAYHR